MVYLNNKNKSGTFLKNNYSFSDDEWRSLVEGIGIIIALVTGMILFTCFCRVLKCVMFRHDSDNPAEELPLQQEMMNGSIPTNRNNNIEIPLIAENAEDWL